MRRFSRRGIGGLWFSRPGEWRESTRPRAPQRTKSLRSTDQRQNAQRKGSNGSSGDFARLLDCALGGWQVCRDHRLGASACADLRRPGGRLERQALTLRTRCGRASTRRSERHSYRNFAVNNRKRKIMPICDYCGGSGINPHPPDILEAGDSCPVCEGTGHAKVKEQRPEHGPTPESLNADERLREVAREILSCKHQPCVRCVEMLRGVLRENTA